MTAATYDGDGLRQTTTTPTGGSPPPTKLHLGPNRQPPTPPHRHRQRLHLRARQHPDRTGQPLNRHITYLVSDLLGSVRGTVNAQRHPHRHNQLRRLGQPPNQRRPHQPHPLRLRRRATPTPPASPTSSAATTTRRQASSLSVDPLVDGPGSRMPTRPTIRLTNSTRSG